MLSSPSFKEECPTCRGHGIMPIQGALPEEAVVCSQCDGRGWRPISLKPFMGRPQRRANVKIIRRSLGQCEHLDAERTGNLMTYDEFEAHFPAERRKS